MWLDRAGWMRTIEDVTPDPESEKEALKRVCTFAKDAEDALFLARVLGIDHHFEAQ